MSSQPSIPGLTDSQSALALGLIRASLLPGQSIRIWLFGSRATAQFRRYSDVDLLIEAVAGDPFGREQLRRALDALEESNLPYKFDLVRVEDLADEFRDQIDRERIILSCLTG